MPQELIQTQEERQIQTTQALQVALARLIELPTADLRSRIEEELIDNAALEVSTEGEDFGEDHSLNEMEENDHAEDEADINDTYTTEPIETTDEIGDYLTEDDVPSYLLRRRDAEQSQIETPLTYGRSFYEELTEQIGEHSLSQHEVEVMEYIIGSLDSDGLLRKSLPRLADELAVYHDIETDEEELKRLLAILQTFEPRGIGATSLQECLLIQLDSPDIVSPYKEQAKRILTHYFKDFVAKHWDIVQQRMKMDDEAFKSVTHLLTHLNPAPGSVFNEDVSSSAQVVTPDFFIVVDESSQTISVLLNEDDLPDLRISPAFYDTVRQYVGKSKTLTRDQSDAYIYAKQKVESAQNFLNLIKRRNSTLRIVMQTIAEHQRDFFLEGDDESLLHPMALKDIAPKAGVDISTVSRVAASKYCQTAYGVYPLRFFFSNEMPAGSGEGVSSRKVKLALRDIIEHEDKRHPFSDEALAKEMQKRGFSIARRTVAKYRDQMGLPSGRLRK
ncbi:MAG: RNA polymerase factor sigma-54 [Bacteroidaceae bacterium]|nr:RNA polymerase factor sigma-54 [Bacteroidaceae bacterium]